jgi:hypothetical protein
MGRYVPIVSKTRPTRWAGCGSNGVSGPSERVECGESLEAEIAPEQVGRDVALTAHAESDKSSSDQAGGQAVGHR